MIDSVEQIEIQTRGTTHLAAITLVVDLKVITNEMSIIQHVQRCLLSTGISVTLCGEKI